MNRSFLLLLIFCFSGIAASISQSPYFTKYTEKDGLSSNHVYKVFQDSKGYIWLATSGGATRFDGDNFKVFGTTDGITDYEVISMYEDSSSRIWFATFNGMPCYYKDQKIYNYENDPLLKGVQLAQYIKSIFEDSEGNIWIGSRNQAVMLNYKDHCVDHYNAPSFILYENIRDEVVSHYLFNKRTNFSKNPFLSQTLPLGMNTAHNQVSGIAASKILNNESVIFAIQSKLYLKQIDSDSIYEIQVTRPFRYETSVRNIDQTENNDLYLATTEGAFICQLNEVDKILQVKESYFVDNNTTSFITDHQNGLWISNQNGVYHYKNDGLYRLNADIGAVNLLNKNEHRIVVSEPNNKISLLDAHSYRVIQSFSTITEPKTIENVDGEIYIITDNQIYQVIDDRLVEIHFNYAAKDVELVNGDYLLGTHSGVFVVDKNLIDNRLLKFQRFEDNRDVSILSDKRVFKIFKTRDYIYVSSIDGVSIYDHSLTKQKFGISTANFRPNDITQYNDKLIMSTFKDGIYLYENHQIWDTINMKDGLLSNQVIKTIPFKDRLLIVTGAGIQYLDEDLTPKPIVGLTNLNPKINGAEIIDNRLVLATADGLLSYDLESEVEGPTISKSDVIVYNNGTLIAKNALLPYDMNSLEIQFQVFDYAKVDENISYRLYPESKEWKPVDAKRIRYQGLEPASYIFQLGDEDRIIDEFAFQIETPFWAEVWFRLLAVCAFLGLMYLFLRLRVKRILKKKDKIYAFNLRLATAEQKALKAQMNPHFIFNSLNAIQNLILSKRTDKAYKYLGDFSKLVRRVLLDSRKLETTVKREIAFLTLYLELEKLRFDGQFHFSFDCKDDFNLDYIIPSMVIQPFVENAIIHGLVPQDNQIVPEIIIKFREDAQYIYCHISDNGIGYDTKSQKSKSGESLGLKIIAERLEIYDPSGQSNYTIESLNPGTHVELQLIKYDESSNNRR